MSKISDQLGKIRESSVTKLIAYYILIAIAILIFRQIANEYYDSFHVNEFEKVYDLVMKGMNIRTHTDELIVTIIALIATFTYALPVAWVYVITKREKGFDESLVQAIILLAVIVTGVMMVVQDSLARAFGLVAILSAVRYRVAVKDIQDATYIFLAIAIGVANGLNVPHIAIVMSFMVNIVYLVLWKWKVGDVVIKNKKSLTSEEKAEINTTLKMSDINFSKENLAKKHKIALIIISRNMEYMPEINLIFDDILEKWEFHSVEKLNGYDTIYKTIVLCKDIKDKGNTKLFSYLESFGETILLWKIQQVKNPKKKQKEGTENEEQTNS